MIGRRLLTRYRCIDGRLWRHDPMPDDPYLETDVGECPDCGGEGCTDQEDEDDGKAD